METVRNAVSSAFGSSNNSAQNETNGTEPVSGQTGAGTANEPFDKGNENENVTNESSNTTSSDTATRTEDQPAEDLASKTEDQPTETSNAPQSQTVDPTKAEAENKAEYTTSNPTADDSAANADSGDVKHPANEDERQEMARKGELPKDPNDHSGEPMKMHDDSEHQEGGDDSKDQAEGEKHDDGKDKGTGEKWVKTSGMAADGGDFDATKPGAGREANRLMEQKGIHKEDPSERGKVTATNDDDEKAATGSKGPGPMEKLKDKLHIGTGSHGNQQSV